MVFPSWNLQRHCPVALSGMLGTFLLFVLCCWRGGSPPPFSCKVYLLLDGSSPSLPHLPHLQPPPEVLPLRFSPDLLLLVVFGLQSR